MPGLRENHNNAVLPQLESADRSLTFQSHQVKHVRRTMNAKKAAGLDGIPGRVLQDYAHQLADVFTDVFAVVPACIKTAVLFQCPSSLAPLF